jgi:hypothetical protein
MILPHIRRRTSILLLFSWILLGSVAGIGFVIFVAITAEYTEEVPFVPKPNADGKLTFPGPTYQLRAWPTEFAYARINSNGEFPFVVVFSIDRRQFGALEAPEKPRVVCGSYGCSYSCTGSVFCEGVENGLYRVNVVPASRESILDLPLLNEGPAAGTDFRCGDAGLAGLELCWDPVRKMPSQPVANVRSVSYPAVGAADVWISTARDSTGHPIFVASCIAQNCCRSIERHGARLDITFSSGELDNWQRFDMGLHDFAARLIEPRVNGSDQGRR